MDSPKLSMIHAYSTRGEAPSSAAAAPRRRPPTAHARDAPAKDAAAHLHPIGRVLEAEGQVLVAEADRRPDEEGLLDGDGQEPRDDGSVVTRADLRSAGGALRLVGDADQALAVPVLREGPPAAGGRPALGVPLVLPGGDGAEAARGDEEADDLERDGSAEPRRGPRAEAPRRLEEDVGPHDDREPSDRGARDRQVARLDVKVEEVPVRDAQEDDHDEGARDVAAVEEAVQDVVLRKRLRARGTSGATTGASRDGRVAAGPEPRRWRAPSRRCSRSSSCSRS